MSPCDRAERRLAASRPRHSVGMFEDLADAIEAGERFGDLRADRRDRDQRRRDQADEEDVHRRSRRASSRPATMSRPPSQIISTPMTPTITVLPAVVADTPVIDLRDVAEQAMRALGEDDLFALLGGVALDDANAAERLGQPAGDFRVDLAALAEQRPQRA